jgi:hypothetical protein
MITVGEMLAGLGRDLADPGHVVWPLRQLVGHLSEAVEIIARAKPDAFAKERILELRGGREWHPVCGCLRLSAANVVGQCDRSGMVWNRLAPVAEDGAWPGADPPPGIGRRPFRLREFSVADDGRTVRPYPRVPPGTTVHLLVRCPVMPDWSDPSDLVDGSLASACLQWAMYRALAVDGEREPAVAAAAEAHREVFNSLIGARRPARRRDEAP